MLRARLSEALKTAMKARDARSVSTVRLILARLKERDIEVRPKGKPDGISDEEMVAMMQGMIKQRRESIELYERGRRPELAEKERGEIAVIESFMPHQLSESEMAEAVASVVGELGASGIKDMGKVMAKLKERFAGTMDFAKASTIVKARLAGS
ncbi:MAG TPA: GatB/YqeY domain-containing protein [Alphaproteobacteria bacterium]|nr:GatB/YqeY domain-containing protein [Alphaproteobacteria bacterium]